MCALLFFCVQANGQEAVDVDAVVKKAERIRQKATAEANQLSQEMLRKVFAILMLVVAVKMFFQK